ncbi:MAG: hypothetical protein AAGB14_03175, partial [Verrucomicrobiota bacterium]
DPLFTDYTRSSGLLTNINPIPAAGSPMLTLATSAGAPATAAYRGAFGTENWTACWTCVAENGFVMGAVPAGEEPDADYLAYAAGFDPELGAPGDDEDGDGRSNDFERLFGTDPQSASSVNPITVQLDPGTNTFSYTRRDVALSGKSYSIWTSTNMVNWTEDAGASQTPVLSDEIETVSVTLTASPAGGKLFVQVRSN